MGKQQKYCLPTFPRFPTMFSYAHKQQIIWSIAYFYASHIDVLTLYQPRKFQNTNRKSSCRQKIKGFSDKEILSLSGRNYCGKRKQCWLPAPPPFPTISSKGFSLKVIKTPDCEVKSYQKKTFERSSFLSNNTI